MDLTLEPGKSVRSLPSEEEGAAETTCDELTITPIPRPPVSLGEGEEVEKSDWSSAWEKGRGGGKVFYELNFPFLPKFDLFCPWR